MILKLQNARKFITTSGSGYIPPSRNIIPSKKSPTAATINQWLKGTFSYITGIKDSDLIESKYRPSKETNTTTKYYTRKGLDYDVMRNLLGGKESSAKTFEGEPLYYKNFNDLYNRLSNKTYRKGRQLRTTDNSHLGEYTIGIGEDNNGRYVSYYDKFDWAPNEKLEIFSPYEIYNRIYEKDFNRMLKELNNETYSGSNPSGNWFFKSGMNNKGYFKFGGKTANARKWKHLLGGIIKSLEGSKVNWGELAVNTGINLLSTISKNKLVSYDAQAKKALNQIDYDLFVQATVNNAIQKMNEVRDQWKQSYLNGDTLDRSFESDAVMGTLQHQFMAPEIAKGKLTLNNVNALVDAEAKALKEDNWSNMFGNVVQTGLGALGNYLGLKKTTTTSLINSQINDFSSGYNLFTKNSVLHNPDKFWNL